MLQDSQWAVTVIIADELPVFKNNHGCSETKKFLFRNLGTNPMTKIRLIPSMPEFLLTVCLSVNFSSWKQCWNLYRLSVGLWKTQLCWHTKFQVTGTTFLTMVDDIAGNFIVCMGCGVSKSFFWYWNISKNSTLHISFLWQRYKSLQVQTFWEIY